MTGSPVQQPLKLFVRLRLAAHMNRTIGTKVRIRALAWLGQTQRAVRAM
jgi:hypothetical protein